MRKKLICIMHYIIIVTLFSGCWSRVEPKDLSMVNSVLYDINDNGDAQIIVEIMNAAPQTGSKGNTSPKISSIMMFCEGKTMPEAIRDETKSIDKVLFGGLNKARLFTEKYAKKGIAPLLDYLSRDHLTDERPLAIVVQDDDPKRIYTCETGLSDMIGNYFESLSHTQHKSTCESVFISSLEFKKDFYDDGKQPVMGLAKIIEDKTQPSDTSQSGSQESQTGSQGTPNNTEKKYYIRYEGLAAFKDDKLVGSMNGIETRAYNLITNNFDTTLVSIPTGSDFTVVSIAKAKTTIRTNVENKLAKIDVKIKTVLSILQAGDETLDISKSEVIKIIEQGFNKQLEAEIAKSIEKAQREFNSDIFGFGCSVHAQHQKEWKELKENWDDIFSKAKITVTVESTAVREGEIQRPFALEDSKDDT